MRGRGGDRKGRSGKEEKGKIYVTNKRLERKKRRDRKRRTIKEEKEKIYITNRRLERKRRRDRKGNLEGRR